MGSDIFCVCVNFRKFIQSLMFSKPVSAACLCCLLSGACAAATPPVAVAAARVLIEQLTVSDRQLILLTSVHVTDSVCVCVLLGK